MRKNSQKNRRVSEEVARALSGMIRELKDPRIALMTSVVDVQVAPDLKTCKVYISVFGEDDEKTQTLAGLKSSAGYLRRELAHSLNLRNTPELNFILDDSIARGAYMSKKIDEVLANDRAAAEENA